MINKNVDWIYYIYYNQQRFVNYTWDGIHGLTEQLDKKPCNDLAELNGAPGMILSPEYLNHGLVDGTD